MILINTNHLEIWSLTNYVYKKEQINKLWEKILIVQRFVEYTKALYQTKLFPHLFLPSA